MSTGKIHIYHIEDGKIVMDLADHHDHWLQARAAMGLPKTRVVAGTFVPLEERYFKKYEEQYKATFDHGKRKPLPEFQEPVHWSRFREKVAKHKAKMEEAK